MARTLLLWTSTCSSLRSHLPGSLIMSNQLPSTGFFSVSAPQKLQYFRKRDNLFNTVESCARKAEALTGEPDYAQGWLALTRHVISTQFTDLASVQWARRHFQDLDEQLSHHKNAYNVAHDRWARYPVSLDSIRREMKGNDIPSG